MRRTFPRLAATTLAALLVASAHAAPAERARVTPLPPAAADAATRSALAAVHADAQPDLLALALKDQAFAVQDGGRTLYLVPVSYASKKSGNGVCELVAMDERFRVTGHARLFGVVRDEDEVVASCTNVLGASFRVAPSRPSLDGVYLMATGVINTYRNAATVVRIDTATGIVKVDARLTAAIDDGTEPQTLAPLMARLKTLP